MFQIGKIGKFSSNKKLAFLFEKKYVLKKNAFRKNQCFFFPVTTKSARDTPPVKFCHGHFWLFTGILSKIVTGKLKNFTVIFSKKVTGKLEISRSIRKKVVTGNLKFVTGTFVLWPQNFWFTAITTKVIFGLSLVASNVIFSQKSQEKKCAPQAANFFSQKHPNLGPPLILKNMTRRAVPKQAQNIN